jgi:hypothetical protein
MRHSALGLLFVATVFLSACGRYGPPRRIPVIPEEPATTTEAIATQDKAMDEEGSE